MTLDNVYVNDLIKKHMKYSKEGITLNVDIDLDAIVDEIVDHMQKSIPHKEEKQNVNKYKA